MIVSKKTLMSMVDQRIRSIINDKTIARSIALEYLVGLSKAQLNRFNDAVELRRQSELKLTKLDESAPDVDLQIEGMEFEQE